MATQICNVKIRGYWRDRNKSGVPCYPGVYFVYEANYDKQSETITLHRLIYIGEADDVNQRISHHEKYEEWKKYVDEGNELCFSAGKVEGDMRKRVEAAYVYTHKPPVNTEFNDSFPFDETTVLSSGSKALLNTNFTVNMNKVSI